MTRDLRSNQSAIANPVAELLRCAGRWPFERRFSLLKNRTPLPKSSSAPMEPPFLSCTKRLESWLITHPLESSKPPPLAAYAGLSSPGKRIVSLC